VGEMTSFFVLFDLSKIYISKKFDIVPIKFLYNQNVLVLIMDQKKRGGKVVLVSGSSILYVRKIAKYLMLFDDVMGSDEKTNLTGKVKALKLSTIYGKKGFDYIGNDFIVS
jgi:hypothetical protein